MKIWSENPLTNLARKSLMKISRKKLVYQNLAGKLLAKNWQENYLQKFGRKIINENLEKKSLTKIWWKNRLRKFGGKILSKNWRENHLLTKGVCVSTPQIRLLFPNGFWGSISFATSGQRENLTHFWPRLHDLNRFLPPAKINK